MPGAAVVSRGIYETTAYVAGRRAAQRRAARRRMIRRSLLAASVGVGAAAGTTRMLGSARR